MSKALLVRTDKYWGWEHRSDNINRTKGFFDLAWVIPKSQYDKMDVESQSYHYPLYFVFREGHEDNMFFTPTEIEKIGKEYDIFLEKEVSGFPIEDTLTILKNQPITYQRMFKEAPPDAKSYQDIVDWFSDPKNKGKVKEGEWEVDEMVTDIEKIITVLEDEEKRVNKIQEAALDASAKSAESFSADTAESGKCDACKEPTTTKCTSCEDWVCEGCIESDLRELTNHDLGVTCITCATKIPMEAEYETFRAMAEEVKGKFVVNAGRGFFIQFDNGYGLSVAFGVGNYSSNRNKDENWSDAERMKYYTHPPNQWSARTAEVAIFTPPDNELLEFNDEHEGDQVEGWLSPSDISTLLTAVETGNEKVMKTTMKAIRKLPKKDAESVGFAAENLEYKFAIISKYDDSIIPSTEIPEGLETIGKVHVTLVGGKALKPFKAALKENAKEAIAGLPEAPTPVFGDMGIAERTMGDGEVRKTAFLEVENQEDFHDYVDTMCDALGIENPESDRWFHVSIANNHGGNPFKSVGDITEADLRGSHSAEYFAFNAEGENMPLYVYDAECGCMKRADTLKFKDWANQEQQSHGDTSFDDWAEHEEESHDERYGAENCEHFWDVARDGENYNRCLNCGITNEKYGAEEGGFYQLEVKYNMEDGWEHIADFDNEEDATSAYYDYYDQHPEVQLVEVDSDGNGDVLYRQRNYNIEDAPFRNRFSPVEKITKCPDCGGRVQYKQGWIECPNEECEGIDADYEWSGAEAFSAESPFSESVKWLNRKTGEIATSIPLLQRKDWVKLDAESDEDDDEPTPPHGDFTGGSGYPGMKRPPPLEDDDADSVACDHDWIMTEKVCNTCGSIDSDDWVKTVDDDCDHDWEDRHGYCDKCEEVREYDAEGEFPNKDNIIAGLNPNREQKMCDSCGELIDCINVYEWDDETRTYLLIGSDDIEYGAGHDWEELTHNENGYPYISIVEIIDGLPHYGATGYHTIGCEDDLRYKGELVNWIIDGELHEIGNSFRNREAHEIFGKMKDNPRKARLKKRFGFGAESFEMEGMLGNWEGKLDDEPVYCPNCMWDGLESDLVQRGGQYSRWVCPVCMRKDWEYKAFENVRNNAESNGDQDLDPHYTPFYAEGMSSVVCDVGLGAAIGVAGAWLTGWWKV